MVGPSAKSDWREKTKDIPMRAWEWGLGTIGERGQGLAISRNDRISFADHSPPSVFAVTKPSVDENGVIITNTASLVRAKLGGIGWKCASV